MLRLVLIAGGVLIATWALMVVLARRLPEGAAKDLATVPRGVRETGAKAPAGSGVPPRARIAVVIVLLWVLRRSI